ncbi:hypothetical protein ABIA99_005271 [Bradyrhizobium sp. LB12.1]|uniref:J domain-containing protein n=1 Tax=Bradyrhizobium sp. LB12.1 TaxID=3156327 RepID=UPI00339346FC
MSRGAGAIERRISDLLAATRDRALTIDDVTDAAFDLAGRAPTRAQRLSATRAAHRVLKRTRSSYARSQKLIDQGHANTEAVCGSDKNSKAYQACLAINRDFIEGCKLDQIKRIGLFYRFVPTGRPGAFRVETDFWCAETVKRRLYFHPPDVPVRVWAVAIGPGGITWVEAEVTKITDRNVIVRYAGEFARLDREALWKWWANWRGVRFVSSRTGRIASELDRLFRERYGAMGGVPPSMQMPLGEAMALLGVPADYTREDVISGFRNAAKRAHPDAGGTAEMFQKLVEARDRLLGVLGTSAPAPKAPNYAPKGAEIIYRRVSRSSRRLGGATVRRLI